jgi:hypothetical protein
MEYCIRDYFRKVKIEFLSKKKQMESFYRHLLIRKDFEKVRNFQYFNYKDIIISHRNILVIIKLSILQNFKNSRRIKRA